MATTEVAAERKARSGPDRARAGYIPEIQGLRTIALLLVASFHVWLDRVSGGVDVFLLISAYLMTRSLTARAESGSLTNPAGYLVRKFARLLPASVFVIILTLAAGLLLMPSNLWIEYSYDGTASAFYFMNLRLQDLAVDYFAANDAFTSPFQHFWSLSIQGQIFVLWAILHLLAEIASRLLRIPVRFVLLVGFGVLFAASLARSVWLTEFNQVYAYFDTPSRVWEFAAGSLMALVQPWLRIPRPLASAMTALGLAGIVSCGFVLPVAATFPGYAALWPVVSAGLVILASSGETPVALGRLLASPALAKIGGYTYALYLTHWPTLIIYLFVAGVGTVNWWQGLLVLAISGALAALVVHLVERPAAAWVAQRRTRSGDLPPVPAKRRRRPAWGRAALAAGSALVVAAAGSFGVTSLVNGIRDRSNALIRAADLSELGANAAPPFDVADPLQDPALVKDDWISLGYECAQDDPYRNQMCFEVLPEDGADPEHLIYNIGNSHSGQFTGALLEVVERHPSWALRTQVAGSCNYEFSNEDISPECIGMWESASSFIADEQPDMVVVYGTFWEFVHGDRPVLGLLDWIAAMQELSPATEFVVVRDNPRLDRSPFDCAMESSFDDPQCIGEFTKPELGEYIAAVDDLGAVWVDVTDDICTGTFCAPVRGGIVTYVDNNHLTGTFARTLAQSVSTQIGAHVAWWPEDAYSGERVDRTPGVGFEELMNKDHLNEN